MMNVLFYKATDSSFTMTATSRSNFIKCCS